VVPFPPRPQLRGRLGPEWHTYAIAHAKRVKKGVRAAGVILWCGGRGCGPPHAQMHACMCVCHSRLKSQAGGLWHAWLLATTSMPSYARAPSPVGYSNRTPSELLLSGHYFTVLVWVLSGCPDPACPSSVVRERSGRVTNHHLVCAFDSVR
jgi:hypothetical protein